MFEDVSPESPRDPQSPAEQPQAAPRHHPPHGRPKAEPPKVHKHRRRRHRPLLACIGSKSSVVDTIIRAIPPHRNFVEAFAGSAITTFAKPPSAIEVVNDLDSQISTVFSVMRDHPEQLARKCELAPRDRHLFEKFCSEPMPADDPIETALRVMYIANFGFVCGQQHKPYLPACRCTGPRWTTHELADEIRRWSRRFSGVTLERLDFETLINKYDSSSVVFFCDPPYPDKEHYYRTTFVPEDHGRLARRLRQIEGKALVTLPDTPEVRDLYQWAHHTPLNIPYSVPGRRRIGKELLIYVNYEPSDSGPGPLSA